MLVNILRFVRGTVTFEVRGDFAERFLNLLGRNGIPNGATEDLWRKPRSKAIFGFVLMCDAPMCG